MTTPTIESRLTEIVKEIQEGEITLPIARQEFERQYIAVGMAKCQKNVTRAAMLLGVHRNTLTNKLRTIRLTNDIKRAAIVERTRRRR